MMNPRTCFPAPAKKPSLVVPAVVLALSLMSGIVAGEYADGRNSKWIMGFLPVIGVMAFGNPTPVALFGAGFAAGAAVGCLKNLLDGDEHYYKGDDMTLTGKVLSISPGVHGNADMLILVTETMSTRREKVRFPMTMSIKGKDVPTKGSRIRMRAELKDSYSGRKYGKVVRGKPAGNDLIADPGSSFKVMKAERELELAFSRKDESVTGLLAALSLGRRWEVDRSIRNSLRKTGTYHLMAISGVHIGSALVLPFIFANVLLAVLATDAVGWKKILPMIGGLMTLFIYLSLTGLSTSAVRAGIFVMFYWVAIIVGRYPHPFTVLGWCVVLIVCMDPGGKPDMALLLSASAVTGILLTGVYPCRPVLKALHVTMGAILFTLPLSVWCAGGISVVAPICNLLAGLVFGFVLIPLAVLIDLLACVAVSPWELLVVVWIRLAMPLMAVLEWFSDLPMAFLPLSRTGCYAAAAAAITALVIWRNRDFRLRTGVSLFLAVVITAGGFQKTMDCFLREGTVLCFPKVGQADAAIFKGGGQTIIIDCAAAGRPGRMAALERRLVRMGVTRIDAVFLTHAHPDHTGGFRDLTERWKIEVLYLPELERDPGRWSGTLEWVKSGTRIISLKREDKIRIGPLSILVLGPPVAGWEENGENARSLQLSVKWNDMTALFTGDAPWEQVMVSLERMSRLDLFKIPHHGSKTGFPPDGLAFILSRLRGKRELIAVFPSPPPGTAALPSRAVVKWFEKQGVRCLFTGQGTGLIFRTGEKLRVPAFINHGF